MTTLDKDLQETRDRLADTTMRTSYPLPFSLNEDDQVDTRLMRAGYENGYKKGFDSGATEVRKRMAMQYHLCSLDLKSVDDKLTKAIESLKRIKKHGCCVMHNDSGCPGCEAHEALKKIGDETPKA